MFKRAILAAVLCLASASAWAQNPTCPNRPLGDSSNACANTRFVIQNAGGGGSLVLQQDRIFVGNALNVATGVPMTGDCSIVAAGTLICTTLNGVSPGTMWTQDSSAVDITGGTITGMPNPSNSTDVANKAYVDANAGFSILPSVRLSSAAALPANTYDNGASGVGATLTANANGALSIDGTAVVAADSVLIKDEAAPENNGVYTVTAIGTGGACPGVGCYVLTRRTDFDTAAEMLKGSSFTTTEGATNIGKGFTLAATVATVGTDPATFNLFPSGSSQWITSGLNIYYTTGKVGVGSSATPSSLLTVTPNATALPAGLSGIQAQIGGANSANTRLLLDAFAGVPVLDFRRAQGTAAAPSAVTDTSILGAINVFGYGASAYTTSSRASMFAKASENWTNTAQGAKWTWETTATGGTTTSEKMVLSPSGNLGIGLGGSSPSTQLHTSGGVRFAGITGVGVAGCLTNDTSGNISAGGNCGTQYVFNVKASPYNATGDGSTNDSTAVQAAIDACISAGRGLVYFPAGRYKLNTLLTSTGAQCSFAGDGEGVSQLLSNNVNGILAVTIASPNLNTHIDIRNLDFVNASGGTSATALSLSASSTAGAGNTNSVTLFNVRVMSSTDSAATEKWTTGIFIHDFFQPILTNVEVMQLASGTGIGINFSYTNDAVNSHGYGPRLINTHVEAMDVCLQFTGALEGIYIVNPQLFGCVHGIKFDGSGGVPGAGDASIIGGAITGKRQTIQAVSWVNIRIEGVDLYKGVGGGTDICDSVVYLQSVTYALIANNKIATAIALSGCSSYLINGNIVDKFIVSGNLMTGLGTSSPGIRAAAGSVLATITGNIIDNLGGQLAISAASNYITCFGNAGGGTGGISTAGAVGGINCSTGNNNF